MLKYSKVTLLFLSSIRYVKLWNDYFYLFRLFFGGFDGSIVSNVKQDRCINNYHIKGINYGDKEPSFSSRTLRALKLVDTDYVLLTLDDYFLYSTVNEDIIMNAIQVLNTDKSIGKVILKSWGYNTDRTEYNDFFYLDDKQRPYKCSAQFSLIRKSYLKNYLEKAKVLGTLN